MEETIKNYVDTCIYKPFDFEKRVKLFEEILAGKTKAKNNQMEIS